MSRVTIGSACNAADRSKHRIGCDLLRSTLKCHSDLAMNVIRILMSTYVLGMYTSFDGQERPTDDYN